MKIEAAVAAAGILGVLGLAGQTPSATHIPAEDVEAMVESAPAGEVSDRQIRMVDAGDHSVGVGVVHRPAMAATDAPNGIRHHRLTEIYRVVEGRGTLVTGGSLQDASPLDPDGRTVRELTGPSSYGTLSGGRSRRVAPGDLVIIPAGVAHGFREIEEPITYLLFRTDPDQLLELK